MIANVWPCIVSVDYTSHALCFNFNDNCIQLWCQTSVSPLGLGKKRLKHWAYTFTFVAFLNITILYHTLLYYTVGVGC